MSISFDPNIKLELGQDIIKPKPQTLYMSADPEIRTTSKYDMFTMSIALRSSWLGCLAYIRGARRRGTIVPLLVSPYFILPIPRAIIAAHCEPDIKRWGRDQDWVCLALRGGG